MIRFWDFKLTGAPPLLSLVVRRQEENPMLMRLVRSVFGHGAEVEREKPARRPRSALGVERLEGRDVPTVVGDLWYVLTNDPVEYFRAGYEGYGDGLAMLANAATFHQITPLNNYVNGVVEQGGGAYQVANVSMHVGAYALEAAGILYVWSLYLPTYAVGVGPGAAVSQGGTGVHVIYGAAQPGQAIVWNQAVGGTLTQGGWVIGASQSTVGGMWFTVQGIPIISAAGVTSMEFGVGNCLITAVVAYARGWAR
jgi:hypothetical protein